MPSFVSLADSATLRRASSSAFKGSTVGSFFVASSPSQIDSEASCSSTASAAAEVLLDGDDDHSGLPLQARHRFGYLAQYFAVGVVYGGLPATTYGFLLGYLNVPSYVYSACQTMLTLPWNLKFLFGALNDCVPICGLRRKPYMAAGWALCTAMLFLLFLWRPPPSYYCLDPATREYLLDEPPCNPESAKAGVVPTLLMMGACLGYVIADVAADGLTVQYARAEPEHRKGYVQSTAYLWRSVGQVFASSLVGLGMNGPEYLGSFAYSLSFNQVCLVFAAISCAMVPVSLSCIDEPRLASRVSFAEYRRATWELMRSRAFFCIVLWQFFNPAIQYVNSTAYPLVQRYWAGVEVLQNQVSVVAAYALFSLTLWVVRERLLATSWRLMLGTTTLCLAAMDAPFSLLTALGVVRNQYFYLGENLITYIPGAVFLVVSCFVVAELAASDNEGLVYGLISTISNCGKGVPTAVSNQLFGAFYPALSNSPNYNPGQGGDQPCFRRVVAYSFLVGYGFALASLLTMPLMPDQRAEARHRMATWPRSTAYAVATVVLLVVGLCYSVTTNVMALTPLACLRFVGGQGCTQAEEANVAETC